MTATTSEPTDISSLAELLPAFEVERLIARGGMGAVYKARQRSLDRDVAIKILSRELGDDRLFRDSFQAEAKAMARLNHPNLVKVFDTGDLNGLLYIVMEYVPGKSLFHSAHGIAIDPQQAVEIIIGVCCGLAHAHEKGIIHRDIKPANILLTPQRQPKIGDFGLARCTRSNIDGLAMGTPDYMAPELISHPEKGDPRSDVHAIGVVLRELLTGVPAGNAHDVKAVISDLTLAAICRKATHAEPALRFADAAALAGQLQHWMASKTSLASNTAKTLVTPMRPPVSHRSSPASRPPSLAIPSKPVRSGQWRLLKNCAIIAFLLCSIHLTLGVYQQKQGEIAHQASQPNAQAPVKSDRQWSKKPNGRERAHAPMSSKRKNNRIAGDFPREIALNRQSDSADKP
jgi:serine/threonine protein kinase